MKFVKVPTSQGCLGKNIGCEKAPEVLLGGKDSVYIIDDNIEETNSNIEKAEGNFFVGGDHSITYPLYKGFARSRESCLVIFDAHADCANPNEPRTHEDFNQHLINDNILHPNKLMLVGLTKVYDKEKKFLEDNMIKVNYYNETNNIDELISNIIKFVGCKDLYLSIDIDVLDVKGTGYPDGKMKLNDLLYILKKIKHLVKKADLVEINPDKDDGNRAVNAGKKILEIFR